MPDTNPDLITAAFKLAQPILTEAGDFAQVSLDATALRCDALHVEEECYYAATAEPDGLWIGWYTPDRWLSESVEADLVHTGDKIDELIEDERVDQGLPAGKPEVQHFRSRDKVFVFRSKLELPEDPTEAAALIAKTLLAYQACFVELGDMGPDEDES